MLAPVLGRERFGRGVLLEPFPLELLLEFTLLRGELLPRCDRPTLCSHVIRPHSAGLVQSAANAWLERATAVWGAVTVRAMHRLLVLYPPPSDPDHFRSYYEVTHLPLVAKLPGLRAYRYGVDVAAGEGESP